MEKIKVSVSVGGYPVFITLSNGQQRMDISHKDLLSLEHAIEEAKRQVLSALSKREWHELDPKLAGKA